MLRFINFVVIKDVIYTEKSLTLVVGTRAFLSQMCPFMFRFKSIRLRGRPKSPTRSIERHFSLMLNTLSTVSVFSLFGSIVFQLTSEVWKRVMGHVVRKPDVTACKNKGVGQPAHPRSLISAFVVHSLEIVVDKLATRTISAFLS